MQKRINGIFIWSYQKNIVPLHREPALGMSAHQRRRVADIIKGVYWRLFWYHEILQNFTYPKQESDKCPLVCLIRCVPQRLTYQRGHSLFILVCRVLQEPRDRE